MPLSLSQIASSLQESPSLLLGSAPDGLCSPEGPSGLETDASMQSDPHRVMENHSFFSTNVHVFCQQPGMLLACEELYQ